ncbi:MAG: hypothetical protein WC851_00475 [Candidatus Shapirobacteria bacterium]
MTDKNIKTQNDTSVNPVIAAVAGAVVAGAAVASAFVLSNKDNQEKIKAAASNIKTNIQDKNAQVMGKAKKLGEITKNAVNDVKNI